MKRRSLTVLSLLLGASLMAAVGTGAIDVFSAKRTSDMKVVTDSKALIAISSTSGYAFEDAAGRLELDFTNGNTKFIGEGFNPRANSEFNDVFTVTNKSADKVYVWLEAEGWGSPQTAGLVYKVSGTNGVVTKDRTAVPDDHQRLLWTAGTNFNDGKGSLAYVELDPGEYFNVDIDVNTNIANGYGDANNLYSDWSHKVIVKANENNPVR